MRLQNKFGKKDITFFFLQDVISVLSVFFLATERGVCNSVLLVNLDYEVDISHVYDISMFMGYIDLVLLFLGLFGFDDRYTAH